MKYLIVVYKNKHQHSLMRNPSGNLASIYSIPRHPDVLPEQFNVARKNIVNNAVLDITEY